MRREGGGGGLANVRSVCRGASLLYVPVLVARGDIFCFHLGPQYAGLGQQPGPD